MSNAVAETELVADEEREPEDSPVEPPSISDLTSSLPDTSCDSLCELLEEPMPTSRAIAEAFLRHVFRIETRQRAIMDTLEGMDCAFEYAPDDLEAGRRATVAELNEAGAFLDELANGLLRWFKGIGSGGSVFELDSESWEATQGLAKHVPNYRCSLVVDAAVRHLASQPSAGEIIAEVEHKRLESLGREYGEPRTPDERGWPWTDMAGQLWSQEEAGDSSPGAGDSNADNATEAGSGTPLVLQLCNWELTTQYENLALMALEEDVPGLRHELRLLGAKYSERHQAALRASAEPDSVKSSNGVATSER